MMLIGSIEKLSDILASIESYPCDDLESDLAIYVLGDLPYTPETPAAVLDESEIFEDDVEVQDERPPFTIHRMQWARDIRMAREIVETAAKQIGSMDISYVVKAFNHYLVYDAYMGPTVNPSWACFEPIPTLRPFPASARYVYEAGYSLVVGPSGKVPLGAHRRLAVGTLDLLLSTSQQPGEAERVLVGIDGYTQSENWKRAPLTLPAVSAEAALRYLLPADKFGMRRYDLRDVRYTYCAETSLLLMRIGIEELAQRVRCLSCVIAGLGSQGELVELWIEGLHAGV